MRAASRRLTAFSMIVPAALVGASANSPKVQAPDDPLRFFEGRTEMVSSVKVIMKKPYRSRTLGRGEIQPDGTLSLVQQVQDDGRDAQQRRWKMRRVGPGRFSGTMTEAVGPVTAEQVGHRYRFRFRMKGNLAVEQWVTPLRGGTAATSNSIVRKLGVKVASSSGTIRKL
jgi:hypothetical protein